MEVLQELTLTKWLWLLGCIVSAVCAFALWSNGDKIRKSPYWVFGFFSYLFLILFSFGCYSKTGLPF